MITLASVLPERISYLWPGRLPLGKLVVFDGDPSTGKSTLTLDIAARTSSGQAWPDGVPNAGPADVLLLSAEDGLADTVVPRATAAGANLARIHALREVEMTGPDGQPTLVPPSLPRDIPVIAEIIKQNRVKLLVVDVLMAYLSGGVDSHRDQDVRAVLHTLAAMAEATGCCVILVRHLNKMAGGNALYRGGGSIGIIGAARAAYLIARDPDDDDRRIFAPTKMNIAAEPAALAYRLVSADELGCARVEWEDGPVQTTAADLLRAQVDAEEKTERDDAVSWLRWYLGQHGGGAPRKDVIAAAGREHSERTLQRAIRGTDFRVERSGFPSTTTWFLAVAPDPTTHTSGATGWSGATDGDLHKQVSDPPLFSQSRHAADRDGIGATAPRECPVCSQPTGFDLVPTKLGTACRRCAPGIRAGTYCGDCRQPRDVVSDGRCSPCHGQAIRSGGAA